MELDLYSKIDIFCGGCDLKQPDGVCKLGGADQIKYVLREECGWAQVNGRPRENDNRWLRTLR